MTKKRKNIDVEEITPELKPIITIIAITICVVFPTLIVLSAIMH